MKKDKIKVVFDTSVYISAFSFPNSVSYKAYLLAVKGKIKLYSSPEIINELVNVLISDKFQLTSNEANSIVKRLRKVVSFVKPTNKLSVLKDEADNRILECAVACKASLIVSGDKHLINLKSYQDIGIIKTADLLHIVQ